MRRESSLTIPMDSVDLGVVCLDERLGILAVNQYAEDLSGFEARDLLSKNFLSLFSDSEGQRIRQALRVLLHQDSFRENQLHLVRRSRRKVAVDLFITRAKGEGKVVWRVVLHDVTELAKVQKSKEKYEKALLETEQLRKRIDQSKDKFINLVGHELRTPLNSILPIVEMLHKGQLPWSEAEPLVEMAYKNTHDLVTLVESVIDLLKLNLGRVDLFVEKEQPAEVVRSVIEGVYSDFQSSVEWQFADENLLCYYDRRFLKQVCEILLSNAFKFRSPDTPVGIGVVDDGEFVRISFSNAGEPLPDDVLEVIFEEFEILKSISHHQRGFGLGLPIAKKMVNAMGGEIYVQSGERTIFDVFLPRQRVLPEELYRAPPAQVAGY